MSLRNFRRRQPAGSWPFREPRNLAVITLWPVLRGELPVLTVSHDADDGGWQFLSTDENETPRMDDAAVVALEKIVELDATVAKLADLPIGWQGRRRTRESPWVRIKQ